MANLSTVIRITHKTNQINGWQIGCAAKEAREEAVALADLFDGIAAGIETCTFTVAAGGTALAKASATGTCASVIAGDTVVIGKTTFTALANAGTPTAIQFRIGTGGGATQDNACAANLAAAINANTTASKLVVASAAAAIVTVTTLHAGLLGNQVAFSSTGGTITCTGSGYLAGGAGDDIASTSFDRS